MKKYLQNFINESNTLLNDTEKNILLLENDPENSEIINAVYRALHSLKGVAGMFEFDEIGELAHKVESILTAVIEKHIEVNKDILNIVYDFIDFVRESFSGKDNAKILGFKKQEINENVKSIISHLPQTDLDEDKKSKFAKTYYILFKPNIDFDERGINLETVFLIIESKGDFIKYEKATPAEMIIDKFYMFWEFIISTDAPEYDIIDGFLFNEDEIIIYKLSELNIIDNPKLRQNLDKLEDSKKELDINKLIKFTKSLEKELVEMTDQAQDETEQVQEIHVKGKDDIIKTFSDFETSRINVSSKKLDELMNLVSELITNKEAIHILTESIDNFKLQELSENLEKIAREIQNNALSMRLIPLESIMLKFRRLVRDLSKKYNKDITFETDGTETELDKTIIDKIAEPLMHVLRNSIDHGIENSEEREKIGKAKEGRIKLFASNEGNSVVIQVHDDGKGIDPEMIRKIAVKKGLIEPGKELSKAEMLNIIFMPGFSTAEKVSNVSGRGVGMDVIRKKITDIRGEVDIDSEINLGTYVTIKLPLTLSIVDTLQIKINSSDFLIPKHLISKVNEISKEVLENNKKNVIVDKDDIIPIIDLKKKFGKSHVNNEKSKVVFVLYKDKQYGLIVDEIIGDHQAVLKPLGSMFKDKDSFSGASILGDSSLALMIDTNKLIKNHI